MSVRIHRVAKALPQHFRSTAEIIPYFDSWLKGQDDRFIKKAKKIFEGAAVEQRYSIMSPELIFSDITFEERNQIYAKETVKLGKACLGDALRKAEWEPESIDFIITVSCTGIMIPSLDAFLINELHLRQDIVRLPVTEMGCAAGISGLIYAFNFLKANPESRAALIAVESPTATFQVKDFAMANIVSAAMFGDGASCVLLSSHTSDKGPEILGGEMFHFYNAEHMMGFKLRNTGLEMVLDPDVPETIAKHFADIIYPFLKKYGQGIEDIKQLIFHPGGKKIMQLVEELFASSGKNINETRNIMRLYGNMSSATVLYVLEEFMRLPPPDGDKSLMLSFGPGFSAQRILLNW